MMPSNLSTLAPATRNMPAGKADLAAVAEPGWQKGRSRRCDTACVANHWSTNAGAPAGAECRCVGTRCDTNPDRRERELS